MPSAPTLDALLDAYNVLGVGHLAGAGGVRRAHRKLARRYRPGHVPASSPEHRQSAMRLAAIDAAHELIRDAPLRHHPMSRSQEEPDFRFTQDHVNEAVRRARAERWMRNVGSGLAFAALCVLVLVTVPPALHSAGLGYSAIVLIFGVTAAGVWLRRHSLDPIAAVDGVLALVRRITTR
jgi:hypothetical protein